jgi:hypothetical protein
MILIPVLLAVAHAAAIVEQFSATSARCVTAMESPSSRLAQVRLIAPGPPPLLSFRYYEGRMRQRYGNLDLVLDDAGH